jgi:hypothetical protein
MTTLSQDPDDTDWNAIRARVEVVADVLRLRDDEIEAALADPETGYPLVDFALRHHQSLDWLVLGDVRSMIAARAGDHR